MEKHSLKISSFCLNSLSNGENNFFEEFYILVESSTNIFFKVHLEEIEEHDMISKKMHGGT